MKRRRLDPAPFHYLNDVPSFDSTVARSFVPFCVGWKVLWIAPIVL
jgi:hypothetical protein